MRSILESLARGKQQQQQQQAQTQAGSALAVGTIHDEPVDPMEAQLLVMSMKEAECRRLAEENAAQRREIRALAADLKQQQQLAATLKSALAAVHMSHNSTPTAPGRGPAGGGSPNSQRTPANGWPVMHHTREPITQPSAASRAATPPPLPPPPPFSEQTSWEQEGISRPSGGRSTPNPLHPLSAFASPMTSPASSSAIGSPVARTSVADKDLATEGWMKFEAVLYEYVDNEHFSRI